MQNGAVTLEEPARFVPLTTVGDVAAAQVLAARLRSEGIEVRVHSQALGPYPVTVGQMAETELWVMSDRLEEAGRIILDAEVTDAIAPADPDHEAAPGMPVEFRAIALVVGIVLVLLFVLRFVRVF